MKRSASRTHCAIAILALGGVLAAGHPSLAVTLGMVDDFQDGTQNWQPVFLTTFAAPDEGPDGLGDHALRVQSSGTSGIGGKLLTRNATQWLGDFTAAGVTRVAMDVRNANVGQDGFDLALRLGIAGAQGTGGQGGQGETYVTDAISIPADDAWHEVIFDLTADDLIPVGVLNDPALALAAVTEFRILHNPIESLIGAQVAGTFFLDNIEALGPAAGLLGDYNNNNVVDAADYTVYEDSFGSQTDLDADGNNNNMIDQGDYDVWFNEFGNSLGAARALSSKSIPEPPAILLAALGVVIVLPISTRSRVGR